ncbi:AraC family transcriptional regulator [Massilia sp.]|uniref:AraC family transcriptional regulator n=1 Tax=Massilia sp. TaxID=1882437 RepID=UPI00289FEED7|nr:AraC family transcriptional regulator [Massilia sp.]
MGKAYGSTMGEYFNGCNTPLAVQGAVLDSRIAITHLRCDGPGTGMTDAIPPEAALLLAVQLRPLAEHGLWLDGRSVDVKPYAPGALTMLDLRTRPSANLASSYECVQFYLPRAALDALSDADDAARLGELPVLNGAEDPVLAHLAQIARMAVDPVGPATPLFLESMLLSLHRHLRASYDGRREPATSAAAHGGLAAWQEARVKDYIEAHLGDALGLQELAALCNLSLSRFGRAFKASTGMTPHRWLVARRLARARELMLHTRRTLADIAPACGFADQSHLAREFRRAQGLGPAAWRRAQGGAPGSAVR